MALALTPMPDPIAWVRWSSLDQTFASNFWNKK